MSIHLMSAIFEGDLPSTKRLIMLSLADHADENGQCYPSISRLCERTGLAERTVQKNLRELEREGHLETLKSGGKKGSNLYIVHAKPRQRCTPSQMHPPSEMHPTPVRDTGVPPSEMHPNHHLTIIEPSLPPKSPAAKPERLSQQWTLSDAGAGYAFEQGLTPDETKELADEFHSYWTDQRTKRTARGWEQAWRNRVQDRLATILRNRKARKNAFADTDAFADTLDVAARMRRPS